MTTWANADLLVEMLDREHGFLMKQGEEARVLLLGSWLDFLSREPQLAGLVQEMSAEAEQARTELVNADLRIRHKLADLWRQYKPVVLAELGGRNLLGALPVEVVESELSEPLQIDLREAREFDEQNNESEKLASHLRRYAEEVLVARQQAGSSIPEGVAFLHDAAKEALLQFRYHKRRLRTLVDSFPGAAMARLKALVEASNPVPPVRANSEDPQQFQLEALVYKETSKFASKVHGREDADKRALNPDEVTGAADQIAKDVLLLTHQLRQRILAGRSRLALVQRYAAQCEAFDAEELRQHVLQDPRSAERWLTKKFAKYLHQQGFNPVLDSTIGALRPDVMNLAPGQLLYVEAKQYSGEHPRAQIVAAYRQVWSTWGRLRNVLALPEAFLVVFRVNGPRAELPLVVKHAGYALYSVLVDISEHAGSREKDSPISFEEHALLPQLEGE